MNAERIEMPEDAEIIDPMDEAEQAMAELLAIAQREEAKDEKAPDFWASLKNKDIEALRAYIDKNPMDYLGWRARLKEACPSISVKALDEQLAPAKNSGEDLSLADQLVDIAKCYIKELWHDPEDKGYASFQRNDHLEHWPINSTGFQEWLSWLAHSNNLNAPSSEVIKTTCNTLNGFARFDGKEYKPCQRVAKDDDGYWLDIADNTWKAIRITANCWQIIDAPPIRFIRTKVIQPLPTPRHGGDLAQLWGVINVEDQDRLMILTWILECYRPNTPYALLELHGEQGSAKSSTQKALRRFIDPTDIDLRGRPRTVEDIFVAAGNNHLLSYENLSSISMEQSDALCTVCTGGGYAARKLYTNGEESTLSAHNPVILNGISPVVIRPDLLDRSVSLSLPVIAQRLTEPQIAEAINQASPDIMGGLLDLFVKALATLPSVECTASNLPRMADFALLGEAIAIAQGYPADTFINLYAEHRYVAIGRILDTSPAAAAMRDYVNGGNEYHGSVGGLLERLNKIRPEHEASDFWPRSPRGLGDVMRRYAPSLRQVGITATVESKARRDGVYCHLEHTYTRAGTCSKNQCSQHSQRSHSPESNEILEEFAT